MNFSDLPHYFEANKLTELIHSTQDDCLKLILQFSISAFQSEDHQREIIHKITRDYMDIFKSKLSADSVKKFFEFIQDADLLIRSLNIQSQRKDCTDRDIIEAFDGVCNTSLIEFQRLLYYVLFFVQLYEIEVKIPKAPCSLYQIVGVRRTSNVKQILLPLYLAVPTQGVFAFLRGLNDELDLRLLENLSDAINFLKESSYEMVLCFAGDSQCKRFRTGELRAEAKNVSLQAILRVHDVNEMNGKAQSKITNTITNIIG